MPKSRQKRPEKDNLDLKDIYCSNNPYLKKKIYRETKKSNTTSKTRITTCVKFENRYRSNHSPVVLS